jgi:hypothetical protein
LFGGFIEINKRKSGKFLKKNRCFDEVDHFRLLLPCAAWMIPSSVFGFSSFNAETVNINPAKARLIAPKSVAKQKKGNIDKLERNG